MKEATAFLNIGLTAMCPNCDEELDLMEVDDCQESGHQDGGWWAEAITEWFNNTEQSGMIGTCGKCNEQFKLTEIEW